MTNGRSGVQVHCISPTRYATRRFQNNYIHENGCFNSFHGPTTEENTTTSRLLHAHHDDEEAGIQGLESGDCYFNDPHID